MKIKNPGHLSGGPSRDGASREWYLKMSVEILRPQTKYRDICFQPSVVLPLSPFLQTFRLSPRFFCVFTSRLVPCKGMLEILMSLCDEQNFSLLRYGYVIWCSPGSYIMTCFIASEILMQTCYQDFRFQKWLEILIKLKCNFHRPKPEVN